MTDYGQNSDPYAKGGDRHWFWWADQTYVRPGLFFRRRRIVRWPWLSAGRRSR